MWRVSPRHGCRIRRVPAPNGPVARFGPLWRVGLVHEESTAPVGNVLCESAVVTQRLHESAGHGRPSHCAEKGYIKFIREHMS